MKVISTKNQRTEMPVYSPIIIWLALDHWHAPEWLYGVFGVMVVLLWIDAIYKFGADEQVDIIKEIEQLKNNTPAK